MKTSILTFAFLYSLFVTANLYAQTYTVKKIPAGIMHINGKGDDKAWSKANNLTDFKYPWETATAPATSFTALWDGEWLYCRYRVKDDSVLVYVKRNDKLEPGQSDRVEIFFDIDDKMSPYYCLELDASGRILDYSANYYRKIDFTWQWPKDQLMVKTAKTPDGYVVETAISIKSLKGLGLIKNNMLHAGLFRAECKSITNGRGDLKWISWIKPDAGEPDFHIPSAFGTLVLE